MNIDRVVLAFNGIAILISLLFNLMYNPAWLLLTTAAGFNLLQASFTGFCPLAWLLKKAGMKPGEAFR